MASDVTVILSHVVRSYWKSSSQVKFR